MTRSLQLTLAILKPDLTPMPYAVEHVRHLLLQKDFLVVRTKRVRLSRARAEQFYSEHKGRFFYNRLVNFMSSGQCHLHILAKEDAIKEWRALMGPTKVFKSRYEQPDTIRGHLGLTDTRNCSHGSDSDETARREIDFFFPEFDVDQFNQRELNYFSQGRVKLDRAEFVHVPLRQ